MINRSDFATWLILADQLLETATRDQLTEVVRLLALNLANYQSRFGELPLENFTQLIETQTIDDATGQLIAYSGPS